MPQAVLRWVDATHPYHVAPVNVHTVPPGVATFPVSGSSQEKSTDTICHIMATTSIESWATMLGNIAEHGKLPEDFQPQLTSGILIFPSWPMKCTIHGARESIPWKLQSRARTVRNSRTVVLTWQLLLNPCTAKVLCRPTLEGTGMVPGSKCPRCVEKWPCGPGVATFVGRILAVRARCDVAVREFELCGHI